MSGDEITLAVLREIRDEIKNTRTDLGTRIDATNQRLDVTNQRLDVTNQRLDVTNQRLGVIETTVQDLSAQQLMLIRYVGNSQERQDQAIADLDTRVTRLEER